MTVNIETAKRLADAGFPQPPKRGITTRDIPEWYFPTATDILKELPEYAIAKHIDYYNTSGEAWFCWDTANKAVMFSHPTNPAEAAAQAWFHEHEKKNESRT